VHIVLIDTYQAQSQIGSLLGCNGAKCGGESSHSTWSSVEAGAIPMFSKWFLATPSANSKLVGPLKEGLADALFLLVSSGEAP
jgi:hypothetical protein